MLHIAGLPRNSGDVTLDTREILNTVVHKMRHRSSFTISALLLLIIFPLALNIWVNTPELFRRAPYEDWDEICSYNHTRHMSRRSFERVYSYGALDTFEFMVARKWHELFDHKAQALRKPLWANGVPESFADNKLLLGDNIWATYAGIDYNYARGISDRSVIFTARIIDFYVTYCLIGFLLLFIISTMGFTGIAVCIPLTWFLFTYGFRWSVGKALPGAQTAILEGTIFLLLLLALNNKSFLLLHISTALCAISANLKADSLMMGLPIFLTYLLVHVHTSTFTFSKIALRSLVAIALFLGALILTNIELATRPISVVRNQMDLLLLTGSGRQINLSGNFKLFGDFLHDNLVSLFVKDLNPRGVWEWLFLSSFLGLIGLLLALTKSPSREVRLSMLLITILTLVILWGIPISRVPAIYGRYFVSGLLVMLIAFGFASYLFVNSFGIERSSPIWGILILGTICCVANSRPMIDASEGLRRQLAENFGLDPTMSRNRAILVIWNLLKSGNYDRQVIVDQHSYADLRFFFDRNVPVVMINAWNFREVLDEFKGGKKPVLGFYVPGVYEDKTVPSWVGKWTPEWEEQYDEFRGALASLPRVYNYEGQDMKLLSWSPIQADDSVFVFRVDPHP
jgi:hypothetical protein